jgi:DNA-binding MarR family transcriptional regulator
MSWNTDRFIKGALESRGPCTVVELAEAGQLAESTVRAHLAGLVQAGVVARLGETAPPRFELVRVLEERQRHLDSYPQTASGPLCKAEETGYLDSTDVFCPFADHQRCMAGCPTNRERICITGEDDEGLVQ